MKTSRAIVDVNSLHITVTFEHENGEKLEVSTKELSQNMVAEILAYGLGRILPDRTSASDKGTKMEDMKAVWQDLKAGSFSRRASGSSAESKLNEAISRLEMFNNLPAELKASLEAAKMGKAFLEQAVQQATKAVARAQKARESK